MGRRNINFKIRLIMEILPAKFKSDNIVSVNIIADIHGNFDSEKILRISEERGISEIFILGDFSPHGSIGSLENVENFLKTLALHRKIYAIPGNCDGREILKIFAQFKINYHGKTGSVAGIDVDFIFFGGSNITPFNTVFEYREDEIYKALKKLFEGARSDRKILLTHCPPFNTKCDFANGRHVGSTAIRKLTEEFQPEINFCSHVHECYGKEDFIEKTRIVNVGELRKGGVILKCGKDKFETERINF